MPNAEHTAHSKPSTSTRASARANAQPAPALARKAGQWVHALLAPLAAALLLGGLSACSLPQSPTAKSDYDLGPLPLPVASLRQPLTAQAALPTQRPLQLLNTSAPAALGSQDMRYRLLYAQALQPRAYTLARWSMPPAQLVHQRVRQALATGGWLVGSNQGANTPVLHIEVDAFEQVFDAPNRSHGLVQLQVSLRQGPNTLAQHSIQAQAAATSADAAGGAQAMAAATDDAVSQLRTWLSQR